MKQLTKGSGKLKQAKTTVERGLRAYEIGEKVHALRMRKKMGLVELGRHTGLSAALLSKIERSHIFPPLGTLLRIGMVFGVGLDYFFIDERKRHVAAVVRKSDRQKFPDTTERKHVSYWFESLDFAANERKSSSYVAEFTEGQAGKIPRHEHDGHETIYVLSGKLGLEIGSDDYELGTGDSIYFDATVPHSYRRLGTATSRAVILTV